MKRRDFVKSLAVAATATTASTALGQSQTQTQSPSPAAAATPQTREARMAQLHTPNIPVSQPDAVATTDARYFTPVRYATLAHLCEILMPAGSDTPSTSKTGTPEFLDFYIGASPAEQQAMYNKGLDRLNADCLKQFNVPFAKADAKQADAVIRPHLKGWMTDHPPREPHQRFINLCHRDIREATINSPAWAAAAEAAGERTPGVGLYWHPIEPGVQTWVNPTVPHAASAKTKHA